VSETKETKIARKSVIIALGIICIVLVAGLVTMIALYTSAISSLNSQVSNLQKQVNDLQNTTGFWRFGNVPVLGPNIDFSPPINMYRAITIALESDGWNASSLINMTVNAYLEYREIWSNSTGSGWTLLHEVTQPTENYSPVQVNGTTYRYIWDIVVEPNGTMLLPPPTYWVDAATGEIVPTPPMY